MVKMRKTNSYVVTAEFGTKNYQQWPTITHNVQIKHKNSKTHM